MLEWFNSMTKYEMLTLILSIVVIVKPLFVWIYKKIFFGLKYFHNNQIKLFFNNFGSYIQIYGACKAENGNVVVNKIEVNIKREKDSKEHKLSWCSFISPIVQNLGNNIAYTNEIAHPFQINEGLMCPVFIEFEVSNRLSSTNINMAMQPLFQCVENVDITDNQALKNFIDIYKCGTDYMDARKTVEEEFFWKAGDYVLTMTITYSETKTEIFKKNFTLTAEQSMKLKNNINEVLLMPVKMKAGINSNFVVHDILK